jgi:hypothetical protein
MQLPLIRKEPRDNSVPRIRNKHPGPFVDPGEAVGQILENIFCERVRKPVLGIDDSDSISYARFFQLAHYLDSVFDFQFVAKISEP